MNHFDLEPIIDSRLVALQFYSSYSLTGCWRSLTSLVAVVVVDSLRRVGLIVADAVFVGVDSCVATDDLSLTSYNL